MLFQTWLTIALVVTLSVSSNAQQTVSDVKNMTTGTATIEVIDRTSRTITLKDSDGETEVVTAGPEVKRFDELKVGDTIDIRYYESFVYQIQKPGAPPAAKPADTAAVTPGTGATPGGTVARQMTTSVTVTALNPSVPSITVKTAEGHIVTRKVKDPKNLTGVAVGDRIDITYTMAVLMSVEPSKAAPRPKS